ncbi:hypothetical protein J6590_102659 [Homalodisca vitripennis]|nr:hypothetical protein J6590_102659 [Homalodisca vitripennis]
MPQMYASSSQTTHVPGALSTSWSSLLVLLAPSLFSQVKGFSVEGRVLWSPGGKPLEGATVMLNEKLVSKTGADGTFYLDSMTPGIYKLLIQARSEVPYSAITRVESGAVLCFAAGLCLVSNQNYPTSLKWFLLFFKS